MLPLHTKWGRWRPKTHKHTHAYVHANVLRNAHQTRCLEGSAAASQLRIIASRAFEQTHQPGIFFFSLADLYTHICQHPWPSQTTATTTSRGFRFTQPTRNKKLSLTRATVCIFVPTHTCVWRSSLKKGRKIAKRNQTQAINGRKAFIFYLPKNHAVLAKDKKKQNICRSIWSPFLTQLAQHFILHLCKRCAACSFQCRGGAI